MQTESTNLLEWQSRFNTEQHCLEHLIQLRWPDGFICPKCHHNHGYYNPSRVHFASVMYNNGDSDIGGFADNNLLTTFFDSALNLEHITAVKKQECGFVYSCQ